MKTLCLAFSLLFPMAGISVAAPYGPQGITTEYQQPGGGKLTLLVFGDEFQARTETPEGYTVIFNHGDQCYYYAEASVDGDSLESLGIKADQPVPEGLQKHQALLPKAASRIAQANRDTFDADRKERWQQRVKAVREVRERNAGLRPAPAPGDEAAAAQAEQAEIQAAPVNGNKMGLTILVQFPDDANTPAIDPTNFPTDQAKIQRFCNGVNYTEDGNTGSVRDYFADQSNNLLTYTQSVTQIVTLPNARNYYNYSDYPANATLRDSGEAGRLVIQHAVAALVQAGFDFSNLSVNANNKILATNVLFAGNSSGVWSEGLWPHQWSMSGQGINVGTAQSPRYVYGYQITNISNAAPVIGTFCHENGHLLLGYPDLYDYDSDSSGLGSHCLMSGGNHNNGGRTPAPMNLHFKDLVGWANLADLTTNDGVAVSLPTTGNVGRRIRKPGSNTEHFVVENRGTGDKWAANVPDRGICIWHIDESKNGNSEQQMTPAQHYEVSLEQADGAFDLENDRDSGDAQDLFDSGDPDFNDITTPDAHWWDGTPSGIKIRVTSPAGANMNVEFGDLLPPNTLAVGTPKGGEVFYHNSSVPITWNANIVGNVKIELLKGELVQATLSGNEANDRSYTWVVSPDLPVGTDYTVRISSVDNPAYSDVSNAVFEIKAQPTLADALDISDYVWVTGGNVNWFAQTATTNDGMDAAQSGDIGHSQNSSIQTTVTGPCTLSFWWKVSSESGYDYLRFYLDGVEQTGSLAKISGNVDWTQKTVNIPAGNHIVKWEYKKDSSDDANLDTAWLDQVVITRPEILVEQAGGISLTDNEEAIACGAANIGGSSLVRTFTIRNTGTADLTGLAVTKDGSHAADFAVGALGATSLAPNATTTFTVQFTAGAAGARNAALHIASNDLDENPFDIALTGVGVNAPANSATWTNISGGSWPLEANWLNSVVGHGSGVTAHFETLALGSNATVTLDGGRTLGGLVFGDTADQYSWTLATGSGGPLTLDVSNGSPLVTVNNRTATISAIVAGSDGLTKAGAGTLVLSGVNTYTGGTNISSGTLALGSVSGLGKDGVNIGNGTLRVNYLSGSLTLANTITVAAGNSAVLDLVGSGVANNALTLGSGAITVNGSLRVTRSSGGTGTTNFSAALSGSGILEIGNTQAGTAPAAVSGSQGRCAFTNATAFNNFTGDILVLNGGNLHLSNGTLSGQDVTINSGGYLTVISGGAPVIGSLQGSGKITKNNSSSVAALSIASGDFSGVIAQNLLLGSGTIAVTKTSAGKLTLSGANTYTGATTISAGTLHVTGSLAATPSTVQNGATLGGTGTLAGTVTLQSGGMIAPGGGGAGNLTVNNTLTLAPGAVMGWDVVNWTGTAGSGYDKLTVTSLNLTATAANPVIIRPADLALTNFTDANTSFVLVQASAGITGFDAAKFTVDTSGLTLPQGTWAVQQSGNNLVLAYTTSNPDANDNGIFDAWETQRFGHANAGANPANGDADGDGLTNFMEYALNSNPVAANYGAIAYDREQLVDGEHLRITVPKNPAATNLSYIVESCGALNDWSSLDTTIETDNANLLIVRDNFTTTTASRRFIRLRVVETPQ